MVGSLGSCSESGVSPVVGVILMLAIVVGLAGLVSVFVVGEIPTEREPLAEISVEEVDVVIEE